MAFQTKRPPIQMELSKNTFNKLVELLNYNALNNSQIGTEANTLKEKLLKYSIPKEDENGKECVKFGFFPKEASENIFQMLNFIEERIPITPVCDYYKVLLKIREERQKQKEDN